MSIVCPQMDAEVRRLFRASLLLVVCQPFNDVAEFARIRITLANPNSCEFSHTSNQPPVF
jgi:hypothetical protein